MELFLASMTQLRVHPFSGYPLGLDYAGVLATAQGLGMAMAPKLFRAVQAAESEWLKVLGEHRGR
jgi:hypothetical protein